MRLGSIPNKEYYEKQKLRISTYKIPKILQLFNEDDDFIYLPRGCYDDLVQVLNHLKVDYNIVDQRTLGNNLDVEFKGKLRENQQMALEKLLNYDNGILVAPTAFGKTVLAIALISTLKLNTLILVDKKNLMEQWRLKLEKFLDVNYEYKKEKDMFGTYNGEKKKLTNHIDIGSISSFNNKKASQEILSKYGLIIVDEVHHVGARTFESVVRNTTSKYIYGLTATPKRSDSNERIVYKSMGDIRYTHILDERDILEKVLIPQFTKYRLPIENKILNYSEICQKLYEDDNRNNMIFEDIKENYLNNKNILILTDRVEHIKILEEKVRQFTSNVYSINGQMKTKEKQFIHEKINHLKEKFIIISTGKYIGEGFDNEYLNCLFITMPFKWSGTLAQYVGRLHRRSENKNKVVVYDYVDTKINMFAKMFGKRLRAYKNLGYKLEFINHDENRLYTINDYEKYLLKDLQEAKKSIQIYANTYEKSMLDKFIENTTVKLTLISEKSPSNEEVEFINKKPIASTIIIDDRIVWYGEINPLIKYREYEETILRIDDTEYARELRKQLII